MHEKYTSLLMKNNQNLAPQIKHRVLQTLPATLGALLLATGAAFAEDAGAGFGRPLRMAIKSAG
jgi:hypothetical protein